MSRPHDRSAIEPHRAGSALRRLVDLVSHRSGLALALMSEAAVTLPQVLLMSRVEQVGSASLSDLGEGSLASTAALSQMIERLVRQGLLDRTEDSIDRRRKAIRTTTRARALLRRLEAARSADYEIGLSAVSEELRARLATALERVVADVERARASDRRNSIRASDEVVR
jgi:DNA-binding MarR family transcriptional regulator